MRHVSALRSISAAAIAFGGLSVIFAAQPPEERWLPGDTHVHSEWSPSYDRKTSPPTPKPGGDARYPTRLNARMAQTFGLEWMVTTDHGGPNHAKLNLEQAYPLLQQSRADVPNVIQFYGMELNLPGMDHHALIMPRNDSEAETLFDIESRFDANEAWPPDPARRSEAKRLEALRYISSLPQLPLMFANHPSRSARKSSRYGDVEPWEFRQNIDTAPLVYRGMEGAPGHQAAGLRSDGSLKTDKAGRPRGNRGSYDGLRARTLGGFDPMTAIVGGLWDALLGEGRRFWIVATSDSHVNYSEATKPGSDFWPGQFHKIYVRARKTPDDILEGMRAGRMFVTAGDLISSLDVDATAGARHAGIGETLEVQRGDDVDITVRFRDPAGLNFGGWAPDVKRVDLIVGEIRAGADRNADRNPTTRVAQRFAPESWRKDGDDYVFVTRLPAVSADMYFRLRGTSTGDLEPAPDPPGENPWSDVWFYSNPVFVTVK